MENDTPPSRGSLDVPRSQQHILSIYQRFEQAVAFVLSLIVAIIIVVALVQLIGRLLPLLLTFAVDPFDHEVFQSLFGMIMTLLIALEFKHSIIRVALRRDSIVQVKTVVLIALIALSRKFVILDLRITDAASVAALSAATLVLGIVYWLLRERDDRQSEEASSASWASAEQKSRSQSGN